VAGTFDFIEYGSKLAVRLSELLTPLYHLAHYRIAGGIGAVFPWIPIKAYRPCPNFIDNGGNYQRSGQGLDEIAFGRDSTFKGGN
jgi:hypothetical protein